MVRPGVAVAGAVLVILKSGSNIVCVHKGLFPPSVEQQFPHLLAYCDVRDVAKAAKDWPV